jgi:PRC-barrel domain
MANGYAQTSEKIALSKLLGGCVLAPLRAAPAQNRCAQTSSITDWVGLPVLDRDGSKIGSMEAVYFDTSTDEPVFITVKVGLIGSSLVFVPLADAVVSPKDLRVAVDKKLAKDAPSIETDGQLESAMEPAVFEHYGLVYAQGASGERRLGRR